MIPHLQLNMKCINIILFLQTASNLSEQKKALEVQLKTETNDQHSTYLELVKAEGNMFIIYFI